MCVCVCGYVVHRDLRRRIRKAGYGPAPLADAPNEAVVHGMHVMCAVLMHAQLLLLR